MQLYLFLLALNTNSPQPVTFLLANGQPFTALALDTSTLLPLPGQSLYPTRPECSHNAYGFPGAWDGVFDGTRSNRFVVAAAAVRTSDNKSPCRPLTLARPHRRAECSRSNVPPQNLQRRRCRPVLVPWRLENEMTVGAFKLESFPERIEIVLATAEHLAQFSGSKLVARLGLFAKETR